MAVRQINNISVKVESGQKYQTNQGVYAVKDGIRDKKSNPIRVKKPAWLKAQAQSEQREYLKVKKITEQHSLATVLANTMRRCATFWKQDLA